MVTHQPCPAAGGGVHHWLLSTANRLRRSHTPDQVAQLLRDESSSCGRTVSDREIAAAVQKAFSDIGTSVRIKPASKPLLKEIPVDYAPGLAELWESSPWPCNINPLTPRQIVEALFPPQSLICCAEQLEFATTKSLGEWGDELNHQQFIVPSPMLRTTGINQAGKISCRCLDNTGPRRFVNVEFDSGDVDRQSAKILHLCKTAPLALVVHSGAKSLHAWFYVADAPEEHQRQFMRMAGHLGADKANWTRCQFARMPEGLRNGQKRQAIFFFNPEVAQ